MRVGWAEGVRAAGTADRGGQDVREERFDETIEQFYLSGLADTSILRFIGPLASAKVFTSVEFWAKQGQMQARPAAAWQEDHPLDSGGWAPTISAA